MRQVYIANDGTEFENKDECELYENSKDLQYLNKKKESLTRIYNEYNVYLHYTKQKGNSSHLLKVEAWKHIENELKKKRSKRDYHKIIGFLRQLEYATRDLNAYIQIIENTRSKIKNTKKDLDKINDLIKKIKEC